MSQENGVKKALKYLPIKANSRVAYTKRIDCNNMNAKDIKTQLIRPRPTYISVLILNALCAHFTKIACVTTTFILMG